MPFAQQRRADRRSTRTRQPVRGWPTCLLAVVAIGWRDHRAGNVQTSLVTSAPVYNALANDLIVTATSVAVDVLQNTSQASPVSPRTSRVIDDRDTRLNVVTWQQATRGKHAVDSGPGLASRFREWASPTPSCPAGHLCEELRQSGARRPHEPWSGRPTSPLARQTRIPWPRCSPRECQRR